MNRFTVAAALSLVLVAAPTFAQAPKPGAPTQKPAAPTTPAQKPAPPTAAPAVPQQAPQPPRPFPEGAKVAFMDIQRVASESAEGKASTSKVNALRQKKLDELNTRNKQLEAAQQKVQQGGNVMSDEARAQAQKEVERIQVDIQRAQQDAEAEMQDLQQTLQVDFQRKLAPIIQQVASERGLHMLLSRADAGIVWADPGLDLTADIIKRFDAATTGAKPPAPQK